MRAHFTERDVDAFPERIRRQIRAQLDAVATRRAPGERQQDRLPALEHKDRPATLLEDTGCPLTVRIVRVGGRIMDSDNLPAGYKALRDAIAAAFGRKSDSEADGWVWEYAQEAGEVGTRVEVYAMSAERK